MHGLITSTWGLSPSDSILIAAPVWEGLLPHPRGSSRNPDGSFDSEGCTTRRMVALKNGLNGPKIAEFVLYTEHSHTTVPKQSIFNADHIGNPSHIAIVLTGRLAIQHNCSTFLVAWVVMTGPSAIMWERRDGRWLPGKS